MSNLISLMTVEQDGTDSFVGQTDDYGPIGVYGGHFVGQALAAGLETVEKPKLCHSLHAYFLRPGVIDVPIDYQVTRLREGRASDVRNISAIQNGNVVFHMMASFKLQESGDEHQVKMPKVDSPETIRAKEEEPPFSPPPTRNGRSEMVLDSPHFQQEEFTPGRDPLLKMWVRCPDTEKITQRQVQVALAFLSDGTLMFNSVIPHGLPFRTHRLTSIDHAVWFHRLSDVSEWMYFDQRSTCATDGRGMNHGHLFDARGSLIMTTAQESMLRNMPTSP